MTLYLVLKHFSWISSWYREGVLRSNYRQAKKRLFKAYYNSKSFLTISFWCNKLTSFIERNHSKVYCIFSCQLWLCSNGRIFINCGWFQRVCKIHLRKFINFSKNFNFGFWRVHLIYASDKQMTQLWKNWLMLDLTKVTRYLKFWEFFGIKTRMLCHLNLKKYVNWRLFCPTERNAVKSRSFECLIIRIFG